MTVHCSATANPILPLSLASQLSSSRITQGARELEAASACVSECAFASARSRVSVPWGEYAYASAPVASAPVESTPPA
jgi:hypothetical protein